MPYSTLKELEEKNPSTAKAIAKYGKKQKHAFLKILNSALETYPDDEGRAFATAHAKVKLVKESAGEKFNNKILELS